MKCLCVVVCCIMIGWVLCISIRGVMVISGMCVMSVGGSCLIRILFRRVCIVCELIGICQGICSCYI